MSIQVLMICWTWASVIPTQGTSGMKIECSMPYGGGIGSQYFVMIDTEGKPFMMPTTCKPDIFAARVKECKPYGK